MVLTVQLQSNILIDLGRTSLGFQNALVLGGQSFWFFRGKSIEQVRRVLHHCQTGAVLTCTLNFKYPKPTRAVDDSNSEDAGDDNDG